MLFPLGNVPIFFFLRVLFKKEERQTSKAISGTECWPPCFLMCAWQ